MRNTSNTPEEHLLQVSQYMVIMMVVLLLIIGLALAIDPMTERICLLLALVFTLIERYIAFKKHRLLIMRYVNDKDNHNGLTM